MPWDSDEGGFVYGGVDCMRDLVVIDRWMLTAMTSASRIGSGSETPAFCVYFGGDAPRSQDAEAGERSGAAAHFSIGLAAGGSEDRADPTQVDRTPALGALPRRGEIDL